jgi:hypothetical protein
MGQFEKARETPKSLIAAVARNTHNALPMC